MRRNYCQACTFARFGVRTRRDIPHTCGINEVNSGMGSVNFFQITAYQQCLDCKLITYDHAFNDYVIRESDNCATTTINQRCPNCGSKNISGRYRDADLQRPEETRFDSE